MNVIQRIILILGAITLLVILGTTEEVQIGNSYRWNTSAAVVRSAIVSAVTAALYFAASKAQK